MLHTRPPRGLPGVLFATLVLVLIVYAGATQQFQLNPQASSQTSSDTLDRPTSKPYTGDLAIFEDKERERNLQIQRVMDVLGLKEGSFVADIGAGSGWFTVRAARRVGSSGRVYAVDINRDYLKYIEARAYREKISNVRTVLGKEDDPLLPKQSMDLTAIRSLVKPNVLALNSPLEYDFVKPDRMDYFLVFQLKG